MQTTTTTTEHHPVLIGISTLPDDEDPDWHEEDDEQRNPLVNNQDNGVRISSKNDHASIRCNVDTRGGSGLNITTCNVQVHVHINGDVKETTRAFIELLERGAQMASVSASSSSSSHHHHSHRDPSSVQ